LVRAATRPSCSSDSGRSSKDQGLHLGQPAIRQAAHVLDRLGSPGRIDGQVGARRLGPQHDAVQRLRDRVVQLARQALPFLQGGLGLHLGKELGVGDGDRGLVGDGRQEGSLLRSRVMAGLIIQVEAGHVAAVIARG
jgi:hypothetical protein